MSPRSLVLACTVTVLLVFGSYFVLSPIAKEATDARLAKIGVYQSTTTMEQGMGTTSSQAHSKVVTEEQAVGL